MASAHSVFTWFGFTYIHHHTIGTCTARVSNDTTSHMLPTDGFKGTCPLANMTGLASKLPGGLWHTDSAQSAAPRLGLLHGQARQSLGCGEGLEPEPSEIASWPLESSSPWSLLLPTPAIHEAGAKKAVYEVDCQCTDSMIRIHLSGLLQFCVIHRPPWHALPRPGIETITVQPLVSLVQPN